MELFKDGKRYKDFTLQTIIDGEVTHSEVLDSNELFYRMQGWKKEWRDLEAGRITSVSIPHEDFTNVFAWKAV